MRQLAALALLFALTPAARAGEVAGPPPALVPAAAPALVVSGPHELEVFAVSQFDIGFAGELSAFAGLPDDQVNDAYDADRDGVFLRLNAVFSWAGPQPLTLR